MMKLIIALFATCLVLAVAGCNDKPEAPVPSPQIDVGLSAPSAEPPAQEIQERAGIDDKTQVQSGLRIQLQTSRQKTTTGKSFSDIAKSGLSSAADTAISAGPTVQPAKLDASVGGN